MIAIGSKLSTTAQSLVTLPFETLNDLIITESYLSKHTELPTSVIQEIYAFIIISPDNVSLNRKLGYYGPSATLQLTLDQVYDKLELYQSIDTKEAEVIKQDCIRIFDDLALQEWYFHLETLIFPQNIATYVHDTPFTTRLNCLLFVFFGIFNYINVFSMPIIMIGFVIVFKKQLITNENKDNISIILNIILGCIILDCFEAVCFGIGNYYQSKDYTQISKLIVYLYNTPLQGISRKKMNSNEYAWANRMDKNHPACIFYIDSKSRLSYYQDWILLSSLSKLKNVQNAKKEWIDIWFNGRYIYLSGDNSINYGINIKHKSLKWQNSKYIEYWWKYKKFYFLLCMNLFCYVILQVFNILNINRQNGKLEKAKDGNLITAMYISFAGLVCIWVLELLAMPSNLSWFEWKCRRQGKSYSQKKMPLIGYIFMFLICFLVLYVFYGVLFDIDNTFVYVVLGFVIVGLTCGCFFCCIGCCLCMDINIWDCWPSCGDDDYNLDDDVITFDTYYS